MPRERTHRAVAFLHDHLADEWRRGAYGGGSTEPWTQALVTGLLCAIGAERVIEIGTFLGHTSAALCLALARMGSGTFIGAEPDHSRLNATVDRLNALHLPNVEYHVHLLIGLELLRAQPDASTDLIFLDGDHTHAVVRAEFAEAMRVVRRGGLVTGHDVMPGFDLAPIWQERGGIALTLEPFHALGGGLGIWQKPL